MKFNNNEDEFFDFKIINSFGNKEKNENLLKVVKYIFEGKLSKIRYKIFLLLDIFF